MKKAMKLVSLVLAVVMLLGCLTACGSKSATTDTCTLYPVSIPGFPLFFFFFFRYNTCCEKIQTHPVYASFSKRRTCQ